MTLRLPRIEAVLGARIEEITPDHINAALAAGVEEAADLDFEQADYTDAEELAKDVAAMANAVGGLIIGVREEKLRAVELTPVPLFGDQAPRYRRVLASRVTPMRRDPTIRRRHEVHR